MYKNIMLKIRYSREILLDARKHIAEALMKAGAHNMQDRTSKLRRAVD